VLSLTQHEREALSVPINLADGHARQDPTSSQARIISRLPEFFTETRHQPLDGLERRAQAAFLGALRQSAAPVDAGRVVSVYSSSVATMIVGRYLHDRRHRMALIHPTFDNISDLLNGLAERIPVSEQMLESGDWRSLERQRVTCVFLTTPNNPSGWHLGEGALRSLVAWAAERGVLLCFDTSFRGFDTRTQFDMYRTLEDAGVDYVVLEDTGKLWPMSELKLGFIAMSASLEEPLKRIVSDVLLSVSPVVLRLVEELAHDYAEGGAGELHGLIEANRGLVRKLAADLDSVTFLDPDARVSICRLRFESGGESLRIRAGLRERGVHVLPLNQFYWADPPAGARELRIALARNSDVVDEAMARLRDMCRPAGCSPRTAG
jgi:aspartate/methionine/tyrosine aminotransferase